MPERSCESDSMRDKEVEEEHVCTLCGKGFRSGKALGGHMRVHAQRHRSDQLKTSVVDGAAADGSCDMDVDEEEDEDDEVKRSCDELQMKDGGGKPICPICRRDFPSNKALFGHMRCHPERKWRGIQPPVYSSSSTVSDVQAHSSSSSHKSDHNDGDPFKSEVTDLEKDLLNFGWAAKARRGREGTVKSIAPEQAAGVQNLILLSRGGVDVKSRNKAEVGAEIKSKPLPAGPAIRDSTNFTRKLKLRGAEVESRGRVDHGSQKRRRKKRKTSQVLTTEEVSGLTNSGKKSKLADEEVEGSHDDGTQDLMIVESNPLHQLSGRRPPMISATEAGADVMPLEKVDASPHGYNAAELMQADLIETKKTQKVRKYLMISDLKPMSANLPHSSPVNPPPLHQDINTEVSDNERYKCTTCSKTFTSHQALGGHKSSHNKLRNPQVFRTDLPRPDSFTTQGGGSGNVDAGASHISGLIMAAAASAATPVHPMHQCNVCFKIYPTGQALGGHKRLHCSLTTNKTLPLPPPSIVIQEPAEAAASFHPSAPPLAQASDNDHGVVGRFDLNELPAVEDEDDQHAAVIQPVDNIAAGDDKDAHEPGDSPAALDY
uniref:C2H2-type domain-containing protein n=1 Tax=Kalanchoe fedtschenkoi TaxID=63787 RepID=A0A7N0RBU8_KALFE